MTLHVHATDFSTMPPVGFVAKDDGIYWLIVGKDDEIDEIHLCGAMRVLALARSPKGSGWSKLIEFSDLDGRSKQVLVPEEFPLSKKVAMLKQKGL